MIAKFESVEKFAALTGAAPNWREIGEHHRDLSWFGGLDFNETVRRGVQGDASRVAMAERLLAKIDSAVETPRRSWTPSPFGAYPIVPEFLAGHPDCMRSLEHEESEAAPITVYASISASCSIRPDDMTKRGAAILALVMKLQEFRPVELQLLMPWNAGRILQVTVGSRPLNLSTACFALCHPAFFRWLGHAQLPTAFPKGYGTSMMSESELRREMNFGTNDVYIDSYFHGDVIENPVKWVNDIMRRFVVDKEEAGW